jgi:Cu-processing system permease protein
MAAEPISALRVVRLLAARELREAVRTRWFLICAGVFAVLALSLSVLGLSGLGTFGVTGFGRTAASLLQLVMVIVPLMGLLMGATSVAAERDAGTLVTLLAQPVTPAEVLAGKFVGGAMALAGAVLAAFGASGAVIASRGGWAHASTFGALGAFTLLLSWATMAVGLFVSVVARRGATALGVALALWLVLVLLSDLGLMGTAMVLRLSPGTLLWAAVMNPAQAFRIGTLGSFGGALELLGPCGRYAQETLRGWTVPAMAGLLAAWIAVPLAMAWRAFARRGAA